MSGAGKNLYNLLGSFTAFPDALLLNVLCKYTLPQRELRVLMAMAYKSWGRSFKGAEVTQRELASLTAIDPRNMSKVLKSMKAKRILRTRKGKQGGTYIEINLNYMTWDIPERDHLFKEHAKLSTISKDVTGGSAVPGDGTPDAPLPSPGTAKPAVSGDGIEWPESESSAYFVGIAKKILIENKYKKGIGDA